MTIAVDFDGTIVTHEYPKIGKEMSGAISTLQRLQAEGHRLILWTVREGELLDEAVAYCRSKGLEFFAVNENYAGERHAGGGNGSACRKLNADIYIDDRNAGGFPGWEAICQMIARNQSYGQYYCHLQNSTATCRREHWWNRIIGR